jgi:glycosyltransferase involved in cell wall biosynthesis
MNSATVSVIIPALNEAQALPAVLTDLERLGLLDSTIVVDNGSHDGTGDIARRMGARVEHEPERGYGAACLRGLAALERDLPGQVVVFMDADRSDDPDFIPELVRPVLESRADLVLGSRTRGQVESGALLPHQRAGNFLICEMIHLLFGRRYSDLGPFRAINRASLKKLQMRDRNFGWTAEMQVKAILMKLRVMEVPVPYRRRIGVSKISGTLSGSVWAALKIGWTLVELRVRGARGLFQDLS